MTEIKQYTDVIGKTITEIKQYNDSLDFTFNDGERWSMQHLQDCCESVNLIDVVGDLKDLIGKPLLMAESVTESTDEKPDCVKYADADMQWTFIKFATINGTVTLRWFGSSNGYYSVDVDFIKLEDYENSNGMYKESVLLNTYN